MKPKRAARYRDVIARRQANLTVVLENVHDPHNIGAVMRTCDSVGIHEIFVVNTDTRLQDENLYIGNQTSSGARKWIKVHFYTAIEPCFQHIKSTYQSIWATHLSEQSKDLYELDLTQSVALLFGNEKEGISQEALQYADGNFTIPQMGMVQSLNISVACAVTLYEALRQRKSRGFYDTHPQMDDQQQAQLFEWYCKRSELLSEDLSYVERVKEL